MLRIGLLVVEIVVQILYEMYRISNFPRFIGMMGIVGIFANYALLFVIGFTFTYKAFVPKNKKLPVVLLGGLFTSRKCTCNTSSGRYERKPGGYRCVATTLRVAVGCRWGVWCETIGIPDRSRTVS